MRSRRPAPDRARTGDAGAHARALSDSRLSRHRRSPVRCLFTGSTGHPRSPISTLSDLTPRRRRGAWRIHGRLRRRQCRAHWGRQTRLIPPLPTVVAPQARQRQARGNGSPRYHLPCPWCSTPSGAKRCHKRRNRTSARSRLCIAERRGVHSAPSISSIETKAGSPPIVRRTSLPSARHRPARRVPNAEPTARRCTVVATAGPRGSVSPR